MTNAKKGGLAKTAAAVTKNLLGVDLEKPRTMLLPKAVSEIHVSAEDVVPAGTVITDEIAELAGLDDAAIGELEAAGHVTRVEVFATAIAASAEG